MAPNTASLSTRYTTHNQTRSVIRVNRTRVWRISEPEKRDCSPIEYLGIRNLPVQPFAEHIAGLLIVGWFHDNIPGIEASRLATRWGVIGETMGLRVGHPAASTCYKLHRNARRTLAFFGFVCSSVSYLTLGKRVGGNMNTWTTTPKGSR